MMLLLENIKLALSAIRSNKMRSFLTMLGIIIGISAVIAIVSIGDTMRAVIAEQYESIGKNRVIVYVGYVEDYRYSDNFTIDDMKQIQDAFEGRVAYIAPNYSESGVMTVGHTSEKVAVNTVAGNYNEVQPMNILWGRMINEIDLNTSRLSVVLEKKTALKYFGRENVVGETIRLEVSGEREEFQVVGVYEEQQSFLMSMMGTGQDTIYVPYTVYFKPYYTVYAVDMFTANDIDDNLMEAQVKGLVARMKNRQPQEIVYYSAKAEMSSMDSVMAGMSVAVGAIAAISLLVGGIGIMNIMLVSVTERTREIGIRKALGARTNDILLQFLIESALISAAGGIIGTTLGIGTVALGGLLLGVSVVVNPMIVIIAVAFSAIVGIFFGIYPARKAAAADPINALRYE